MNGNNTNGRLSAQELQFASWWVRNGATARRATFGLLIGLSVIFWGYAVWGLLDAYAISYPRESRINRDIALNQQLLASLEQDRPQEVTLSEASVFQNTDGRYDMMVEATNPNAQWWAEFNYRFSLSGEQTPVRSGYILPQSKQVLTELGFKPSAKGGRSAALSVENVRWHRVDPKFVGADYQQFMKNRLNLTFEDIKYDTDINLGAKKIGQTSFTLVNNSAYGFWNVDLIVRLYRGSNVIAVNQIKVTNLSPGESRPMQIVWLDNLPNISRTEVLAQVNIVDPASYLPTQYFK